MKMEIILSNKDVATIDDDDSDLVIYRWHGQTGGYAYRQSKDSNRKVIKHYMHREIMERVLGRELIKGEEVDHENRNKLDNRRSNLRLCSRSMNVMNRPARVDNKSGYKGVSWSKQAKSWVSEIQSGDTRIRSAGYESAEDAAREYDRNAKELHGEFAVLNFPE